MPFRPVLVLFGGHEHLYSRDKALLDLESDEKHHNQKKQTINLQTCGTSSTDSFSFVECNSLSFSCGVDLWDASLTALGNRKRNSLVEIQVSNNII